MIPDSIIVRCGEMFLKGGNLPYFENRLLQNTKAITGISTITKLRGRLLLPYFPHHSSLRRVFGIYSYSPALKAEKTLESIQKIALTLLRGKSGTFKIETRRSDKRFPLTSPQINKEVGQYIEASTKWQFDFAHPDIMIYIEINNRGAYLYTEIVAGAGGLPVGTAGKINVRIETEVDILAGLLMMKRGCTILPLCIGEEKGLALLQKFSAQEIKPTIFKNRLELYKYIQENKIPFVVTGENFETRRESSAGVIVFKPLIAYTPSQIIEEIMKFKKVS